MWHGFAWHLSYYIADWDSWAGLVEPDLDTAQGDLRFDRWCCTGLRAHMRSTNGWQMPELMTAWSWLSGTFSESEKRAQQHRFSTSSSWQLLTSPTSIGRPMFTYAPQLILVNPLDGIDHWWRLCDWNVIRRKNMWSQGPGTNGKYRCYTWFKKSVLCNVKEQSNTKLGYIEFADCVLEIMASSWEDYTK